jgi:hypothetical protein
MACAHGDCRCLETPVRRGGKSYCSEKCADAQAEQKHEGRCPCGHKDCGPPRKR